MAKKTIGWRRFGLTIFEDMLPPAEADGDVIAVGDMWDDLSVNPPCRKKCVSINPAVWADGLIDINNMSTGTPTGSKFLRDDRSWQLPPGAGGGEANTASNVGTAGVGVFKQKTGVDLEFKKVKAASTKLTVVDNTGASQVDLDADPNVIVGASTDSRLSDARTPTAHATSHKSGGSDSIKLDELAAPTDVTTLNATASAHGLLPKLSNVVTEFLNGQGGYTTPPAGGAFGSAVLNFGATPSDTASVVITGQAGILSGSNVRAWFMRSSTGDNGTDEHEEAAALCPLVCGNIVPATGFTIYAHTLAMLGTGQFTVFWNWN